MTRQIIARFSFSSYTYNYLQQIFKMCSQFQKVKKYKCCVAVSFWLVAVARVLVTRTRRVRAGRPSRGSESPDGIRRRRPFNNQPY